LSETFLPCIFLGCGLGMMPHFRGLRTHLVLCHLSSSCGYKLSTLFTRPL
jgi:hypothetical protein